MKSKMRLALLAVILTAPSLSARASESAPPPCDTYCDDRDFEVLCSCPEWTDQRVEVTNCRDWDGYRGCWWF
ncbi:MAG TPA: hypothetical protein VJ885_06610 [Thermoanaerobaculia bacterium]|nr:hypothetical protein [Thermoanaerobaculia bacterium]